MEVSIRKATLQDYAALCELYNEIDALHRNILPHIFQKPAGPVREYDYYTGLISDENVCLLVAQTGENLVGLIHVAAKDMPLGPIYVPRRYAVVDTIVVVSSYQNQGIGRMLMDEVNNWAIAQGAADIEMNVFEFNQTAIAFYQSLGYDTLSRKMIKRLNRG